MEYDGQTMGAWEYLHVPKGVPMAVLKIAKGSRVLHWREYAVYRSVPVTLTGLNDPAAPVD